MNTVEVEASLGEVLELLTEQGIRVVVLVVTGSAELDHGDDGRASWQVGEVNWEWVGVQAGVYEHIVGVSRHHRLHKGRREQRTP